jgi:hypothetical protein
VRNWGRYDRCEADRALRHARADIARAGAVLESYQAALPASSGETRARLDLRIRVTERVIAIARRNEAAALVQLAGIFPACPLDRRCGVPGCKTPADRRAYCRAHDPQAEGDQRRIDEQRAAHYAGREAVAA